MHCWYEKSVNYALFGIVILIIAAAVFFSVKGIIVMKGIHSKLYPLYVNQIGSGPKKIEITDEFHLSQEKLKLIRKNFVCKDFYFN